MTARTSRPLSVLLFASFAIATGLVLLASVATPPARAFTAGHPRAWTTFNGASNIDDRLLCCAKAPDGSVYAAGVMNDDSPNDGDVFVVKYSAAGLFQWDRVYTVPGFTYCSPNAVTVDAANNVIVAGNARTGGQNDIFTAKWNSGGTLQWYATLGGTEDQDDSAEDVATDAAGNVYVAGAIDNFDEGVVVKYAAAQDPVYPGHGDWQWTHHIFSGTAVEYGEAYALAVDASGHIYVTGSRPTATGGTDAFLVRLKDDGSRVWLRGWNNGRRRGDWAYHVVCSARGIWVGGECDNRGGNRDMFLLHYSGSGHRGWARTWDDAAHGSDDIAELCLDGHGNAYMAGNLFDPPDVNRGALVKYSHGGVKRWARTCRNADYADLAVSRSGSAWLVGYVENASPTSWLVVKYTAAGRRPWATKWPTRQLGEPNWAQAWGCVPVGTGDLFVVGDIGQDAGVGGQNAGVGWYTR
jgi:hypothetical protein